MKRVALSSVAMIALMACGQGQLDDTRFATGSGSLVASSDYQRVFVLDGDAGAVQVRAASGETLGAAAVPVGIDPVRMARAGDRLYVSVRSEGALVVLDASSDALQEVGRIAVGPDAFGVVASEDGTRVFAAVGMRGEVVEIDTASSAIVRRFAVPNQPKWVALHPSGRSLYVGSAMGGTWSSVDLDSGDVETHVPPVRERIVFTDMGDEIVPLTPRITGDLTVSPFGDYVAVPIMYFDNTSPVGGDGSADEPGPGMGGGYAATGPGVGRTNPVVLVVPTSPAGDPDTGDERTLFAQGVEAFNPDLEFDDEMFEKGPQTYRSYISSLTATPDGLAVMATMEGSEAVLAIPVVRSGNEESKQASNCGFMRGCVDFSFEPSMHSHTGGFEFPTNVVVQSGVGPRGVAFVSNKRAVVDEWLDHSMSGVDYGSAFESMRSALGEQLFESPTQSVTDAWRISEPVLDPDVEAGRLLFFSATDSAMAAHSGGISCATCHSEGRNDGLTWQFDIGPRQTPSLAGVVSETTPVTWTGAVPTVATEVRLTSRNRMGGTGATVSQSFSVEAFIDSTPYPDVNTDVDADAVARGRDLFFGQAECSSCHNGANYTNQEAFGMFGEVAVMTPALRGIAATPPYLHDGRAATLRDLVEISENGGMGKTNALTSQQKDDLALFLSTL